MAIMSAQLTFSLSLVFLVSGAHMATISITNNCPYTVWPGTLANAEHPQLAETGFELATRGTKTLNILLNGRAAVGPNAMLAASLVPLQTVAQAKLPAMLQVKGADGSVIACKSACEQFKDPKYCCTGAYADNCPPTNYATIFKNQCPQAYSYPKDDASSVFACTPGANYAITFCP
ncbi:hypothetical protein Patl1_27255 [Pistacia atlantica]|uniref:Uncharacterized protein n=1 Tax=Pistacia atlantica TaxID=434234 RepID=A0ACC1BBR8_9ROSI|nr:hypothetical protein Patl1_27255 [Pistacia atlantica]